MSLDIISSISHLPQLGFYMNTTEKNIISSLDSFDIYFGEGEAKSYVWENLIIEKRIPVNWVYRLYKGSIFEKIWLVLSSPVD